MLANEYGTASNIKSRVNRQSVLAAITSAQQRLKLYTKVPPNGLVVYTGTVLTEARALALSLRGGGGNLCSAAACASLLPAHVARPRPRPRPRAPQDGKEKKMNIDFEPFKPINTSLYLCDNKFHTEALAELLEADNRCAREGGDSGRQPRGGGPPRPWPAPWLRRCERLRARTSHLTSCLNLPTPVPARRYGFIVMDGNGSLFGTLSGNTREVLHKVR